MSRARIDISFALLVQSPLHIGSGAFRAVEALRGEARNSVPGVAAIQRDECGRPHVPGSTLKGLLLRIARVQERDSNLHAAIGDLFGTPKQRGALIAFGSSDFVAGQARSLPYADPPNRNDLGSGVYIASGTAIERDVGVARSSALRHAEAVASGSRFNVGLSLELRGRPDAAARCRELLGSLLKLLAVLARGQAIGAGQTEGDGRVVLDRATLRATSRALGADGRFLAKRLDIVLPTVPSHDRTPPGSWTLHLHCPGPFAILDPSHSRRRQNGDEDVAMLAAQRRSDTTPELPGSSLAGALRARAAWLAAREARKQGRTPVRDDPDTVYKPSVPLTPVQRLFGATGFRALLEITRITMGPGATPWSVHSVKLDRFSGGPVSGALFETALFLDTAAEIELALRDRGGAGSPTAEDQALAKALVADLCANGLMLGHGTTKGFGWFKVTRGQSHGAKR
jgi:CRISPR/Cas system CSM-associated protein Csm3 (group 7 of RAMP superfamily)